jgi:hypothetical protein
VQTAIVYIYLAQRESKTLIYAKSLDDRTHYMAGLDVYPCVYMWFVISINMIDSPSSSLMSVIFLDLVCLIDT